MYGNESRDWFKGVCGALADIVAGHPWPGRANILLSREPAVSTEDLLRVEPTDRVEGVNEAREEGRLGDCDMKDGTGGVRLDTGAKKGWEIVVTSMAFFNNAFSLGTSASDGMKFTMASNGLLLRVALYEAEWEWTEVEESSRLLRRFDLVEGGVGGRLSNPPLLFSSSSR